MARALRKERLLEMALDSQRLTVRALEDRLVTLERTRQELAESRVFRETGSLPAPEPTELDRLLGLGSTPRP